MTYRDDRNNRTSPVESVRALARRGELTDADRISLAASAAAGAHDPTEIVEAVLGAITATSTWCRIAIAEACARLCGVESMVEAIETLATERVRAEGAEIAVSAAECWVEGGMIDPITDLISEITDSHEWAIYTRHHDLVLSSRGPGHEYLQREALPCFDRDPEDHVKASLVLYGEAAPFAWAVESTLEDWIDATEDDDETMDRLEELGAELSEVAVAAICHVQGDGAADSPEELSAQLRSALSQALRDEIDPAP